MFNPIPTMTYLNLPNPTFLSVLIINPNMEFIGTRQKSRFWWVKVGMLPHLLWPAGIPRVLMTKLRGSVPGAARGRHPCVPPKSFSNNGVGFRVQGLG